MKITDIKGDHDCIHLQKIIERNTKLMGQTVLQIGGRGPGVEKLNNAFRQNGYSIFDIVEIFEPNVKWLKTQPTLRKVVQGDIRLLDQYNELDNTYDIVIAWHTIEHINKNEIVPTVEKCLARANKAVIFGCPWGNWPQSAIKGNVYEKHLSHLYPEDFKEWGFDECYTFNAGSKGDGPDRHNVLYSIKFK